MRKAGILMFLGLVSALLIPTGPAFPASFDEARALEFIAQCRNVPGRRPNLLSIYWKARLFEAAEKDFDPKSYASFIRTLQNSDGGFGLWPRDVSTAEGSLAALVLLKQADAEIPDVTALAGYFKSVLAEKAEAAEVHWDLEILRDIHRCLMGLSELGATVPNLERYLKFFEQDPRPWGIYYRVSAAKALGRLGEDRDEWATKLSSLVSSHYHNRRWNTTDKYYALEAMALLGEPLPEPKRILDATREVRRPPRLSSLKDSFRLASAIRGFRQIRLAKLLQAELPWLESWILGEAVIQPMPQGGYAAMPGLRTDLQATVLVHQSLLQLNIPTQGLPGWATHWQDRPQKEGDYQDFDMATIERPEDAEYVGRRIEEAWKALTALGPTNHAPRNPEALHSWLSQMFAQHHDGLDERSILQALECFAVLDRKPENLDEIMPRLMERFVHDPSFVIRMCNIIGTKPELRRAGASLSVRPDRVRTCGIPMELSVLARTFESLDTIEEDYVGAKYFLDLIGTQQNPDGGVRKPDGIHSNLYDTLAAVRIARVLPKLEDRYRSSRVRKNLLIRAREVKQPISLDGDLSEWKDVEGISFKEESDRAEEACNVTEVRALWDREFLYLAFSVKDTNLQAEISERDETAVCRDDGIEFLIDPNLDRTRTYLPDDVCVHINILGTVLDDCGSPTGELDLGWNSQVRSAFAIKGTVNDSSDKDEGYTAEVAFPWEDIGRMPRKGANRLGIDLCVNDRDDKEDGYCYSDWAQIRVFHVPRDWGEIILVKTD